MRRPAFTVLELTVVLTISGLALALAAPRLAALRDRSAVRAAMGELGASFATARRLAITRRTAVAVVIDTASGVVELHSRGRPLARRTLRAAYGVTLGSNRDSAVYDPRGIGYGLSNISVTLRRGVAIDTLTMSRLGRVRW